MWLDLLSQSRLSLLLKPQALLAAAEQENTRLKPAGFRLMIIAGEGLRQRAFTRNTMGATAGCE
jgi:hypothetical protein